jgi:hypothetical protein
MPELAVRLERAKHLMVHTFGSGPCSPGTSRDDAASVIGLVAWLVVPSKLGPPWSPHEVFDKQSIGAAEQEKLDRSLF